MTTRSILDLLAEREQAVRTHAEYLRVQLDQLTGQVSELEAETLRQTEMSFGERPEEYPYAGSVQGSGGYRILPRPEYNPPTQYNRGLFGGWFNDEPDRQLQQQQQRPRRLDPDYFWNHRTN